MQITFLHAGQTYTNWDPAEARLAGVPDATVANALLAASSARIETTTDALRKGLEDRGPGKLVEYRLKAEIARDAASARPEAVAELTREATAKGLSYAQLIALILARAEGYQTAMLRIAAVEAEAEKRLADLDPAAADFDAQVAAAMALAEADFAAARTAARTLIEGGVA